MLYNNRTIFSLLLHTDFSEDNNIVHHLLERDFIGFSVFENIGKLRDIFNDDLYNYKLLFADNHSDFLYSILKTRFFIDFKCLSSNLIVFDQPDDLLQICNSFSTFLSQSSHEKLEESLRSNLVQSIDCFVMSVLSQLDDRSLLDYDQLTQLLGLGLELNNVGSTYLLNRFCKLIDENNSSIPSLLSLSSVRKDTTKLVEKLSSLTILKILLHFPSFLDTNFSVTALNKINDKSLLELLEDVNFLRGLEQLGSLGSFSLIDFIFERLSFSTYKMDFSAY